MFEAKIIAHSISNSGKEIFTYQLKYPRFIHAEAKTHRVLEIDSVLVEILTDMGFMDDPNLSRNASSSRAIPVAKMIEQVRTNPAMPIHWGANQSGMQADREIADIGKAKDLWRMAATKAADIAEAMLKEKLHKQVANRILEPFQWISVVVTATEWDNFHALRSHKDAQPEIKLLSDMMLEARAKSTPQLLETGEWHLPYIRLEEDFNNVSRLLKDVRSDIRSEEDWYTEIYEILKKVSAARCARVSYLTHDGKPTTVEADLALCERLAGAQPFHASPFEHQATPDYFDDKYNHWRNKELHGNFVGWIQARKMMVGEHITDYQYT